MEFLNDILQKIQFNKTELIRFLFCDNGGITRCKAALSHNFKEKTFSGIGISNAQQAVTPLDMLADIVEFEPVEEVFLIPDLNTFKLLPYTSNSASVICDIKKADGTDWETCPRYFLKRMINCLEKEFGIKLQAAFENEFTLFCKKDDGTYFTLDETGFATTTSIMPYEKFILECIDCLRKQNIIPEIYYPESGFGQQELSIKHSSPLEAADNQIFFKETVRSVAFNNSLSASFTAKPNLNQCGNGCHIHISCWDSEEKENLLYDPSKENNLSQKALYFIGGILKNISSLLALTAPTVNSYRRLIPNFWASAFNVWGFNNREAAVRVLPGTKGNEKNSLNFEYKPSDPAINPYIALGALIAAGMDGLRNKLAPGENVQRNPAKLSEEEKKKYGIKQFPATLKESISNLESNKVLLDAMGSSLSKSYIALKKLEFETFENQPAEFEIKNHIFKY